MTRQNKNPLLALHTSFFEREIFAVARLKIQQKAKESILISGGRREGVKKALFFIKWFCVIQFLSYHHGTFSLQRHVFGLPVGLLATVRRKLLRDGPDEGAHVAGGGRVHGVLPEVELADERRQLRRLQQGRSD